MHPPWYYKLGKNLTNNAKISIPIDKLLLNLFLTIIPTHTGMLIALKYPTIKKN